MKIARPPRAQRPGRSSLLAAALAGALLLLGLLLPAGAAGGSQPDDEKTKDKKDKRPAYALLVGSVFTQDGFSLPRVRVSIKRKNDRKPKWRAVSDRRGEFAVRLPAGRASYEVTTHSKRHVNETKTVEVHGEERVDVLFRLAEKKQEEEED